MEKKLKELDFKQKVLKLAPIILRKTRYNISKCNKAFTIWRHYFSSYKDKEVLFTVKRTIGGVRE